MGTIQFEYIVGLAWYYFSNKTIDLLKSYNLILSGDFEPLTHAGGGAGDIVIDEENQVIMLEVTLMNPNAQKRGELEPVLRHSTNLTVKEKQGMNREVTTFFIANEFDPNTINLWKSSSNSPFPLESTEIKGACTNRVVIIAIKTNELIMLIDYKNNYPEIIKNLRSEFLKGSSNFAPDWRDKLINSVIEQHQ